jgi:hypothetical protein
VGVTRGNYEENEIQKIVSKNVSPPATEESAPVSSLAQPDAIPGDRHAIDAEPAADVPNGAPPDVAAVAPVVPARQPDAKPVVAEGRQQVLAAFARNRAPPSPQPAAPQPRPPDRPWFAGPEAPQPKSEMTDDGWRFLLEGFHVGSVAWAQKHGPPPGTEGCRVPRRILKEFGF